MLDKPEDTPDERLDRIEKNLDLLMRAIIVQQKDAAVLAEVTDDTLRNMALRGELEPLQADGSRLNFYTLKQIADLKPRRRKNRK